MLIYNKDIIDNFDKLILEKHKSFLTTVSRIRDIALYDKIYDNIKCIIHSILTELIYEQTYNVSVELEPLTDDLDIAIAYRFNILLNDKKSISVIINVAVENGQHVIYSTITDYDNIKRYVKYLNYDNFIKQYKKDVHDSCVLLNLYFNKNKLRIRKLNIVKND